MKKTGILNREISAVLAKMGHTDTIIIADCGLPIPEETQCIDLSITLGTPSFISVLEAVLADLKIESVTLAAEIKEENDSLYKQIQQLNLNAPTNYVSHEKFKQKIQEAKAVIRTGEASPFANIILHSGVIF